MSEERISGALSQTDVGRGLLIGATVIQRAPGNVDPTGTTSGNADGLTLFWDSGSDLVIGVWSASLGAWKISTLS